MSAYLKLEKVLKSATKPLTCTDLFEKPEVRNSPEIHSPNDVSDRLGYLWRRGLLVRQPAPRSGAKSARYAYSWRSEKSKKEPAPKAIDDVKIVKSYGKLTARRDKDGSVTLTTDDFEITVRPL